MGKHDNWSVYILTAPNGKVYVGTTRRTPKKRWAYGYGYEKNVEFFSDIKLFGWKNIKKEVVSEFDNAEDAYELEKRLIAKYNSADPSFGYNKATGGFGASGVKVSGETRYRLSESHIGKKLPHNDTWNRNIQAALKTRYETHPKPIPPFRGKPVLQYTRELVFVREYQSSKDAERQTGAKSSNIGACCHGRVRTAGGYIWKFKNEKE